MTDLDTIGKGAGALAPAPRRLYLAWLGGFLSGLALGLVASTGANRDDQRRGEES
jgi:hypothetical protein